MRTKVTRMSNLIRIADGSGLDSNKSGRLLPWTHPKATPLANDYPFVGGRTPGSMKWVAVELTDGTVTTVPKNRVTHIMKARTR
jgi:hypothetical protein